MPEPAAFPETLSTKRLLLRVPTGEHAAEQMKLVNANLEHLRPWMSWAQQPVTLEAQTERCLKSYERFLNSEDLMYLTFSAGRLIGACGIHRLDWSVPVGDIGYWLAEDAQGYGYATELAGALTELALRPTQAGGLGFGRIEIRCDPRNARSAAVPLRLGYEREAVLKRSAADAQGGVLRDTLVFARWSEEGDG
ncbi:GNAT family protein [Deinococcus sp.]|uniref:GNAT family N-acetyltransferase n=1 Tax=Deinococcus sp. TaxID=47478 RepID=UPI0025DFCD6E|nr:GNAT family protein [Deinococcus sp.]